jgi:RecA-family ATPase
VKRLGIEAVVETVPYETEDTETAFLVAEEYIDQDYPQGDWVIRTVLREREVMVLTGFEGHGKSALLKQIAMCTALGLHPFTTGRTDPPSAPRRVLYIDSENQVPDCIEDFARLRAAARADKTWHPEAPLFIGNITGMNLASPAGVAWLVERVTMHQPDLLVIGPVYNLVDVVSKDEEMVRALMRAVTAVHQVSECAVLIEHHSPHEHVDGERVVRPIGTTMMMRWPSFGFGLKPLHPNRPNVNEPFEFFAWRGGRRRGRTWPKYVQQAGGWFWEEAEPPE